MKNKKILLTLNPKLYELLRNEADKRMQSVQEFTYETLRNRILTNPAKKSRAGRPKKADDPLIEAFTRAR